MAYGLEGNTDQTDKNILIFDLGGGIFDVNILRINRSEKTNFEVLSTNGDQFLGGEDFDNKLVEYVLDDFLENTMNLRKKLSKIKKVLEN